MRGKRGFDIYSMKNYNLIMDLNFKDQQNKLAEEFNLKLVATNIESFKLKQNAFFASMGNFNGFINLYKNWRAKSIQQIIKSDNNESRGNYFESFIYNWIAFNACYSFYRELNMNLNDRTDAKFDQEGKNIHLLGSYNIKNLQKRIMKIYHHDSFKRLLNPKLSNLKEHERIKFEKLLNTTQTLQEFDKDKEEVTERMYWFITYRLKRVRNNLFHGRKSIDSIEDMAIVKDAAKLLNYFLFLFECDFIQTIKDRLID
jgi:hypothetical protein